MEFCWTLRLWFEKQNATLLQPVLHIEVAFENLWFLFGSINLHSQNTLLLRTCTCVCVCLSACGVVSTRRPSDMEQDMWSVWVRHTIPFYTNTEDNPPVNVEYASNQWGAGKIYAHSATSLVLSYINRWDRKKADPSQIESVKTDELFRTFYDLLPIQKKWSVQRAEL